MTNNLKIYVLEEDYNVFAGPDWPSFRDYLNGATGNIKEIQDEIATFTKNQIASGPKRSFNTIWTTKYEPENFNEPDSDLVYKRKAFNLPSIKTDIKYKCFVPFTNVTVDARGRVFVCHCDGFVPFPVGHVMDFKTFDEIFSSPEAVKIQESIASGEYNFCAVNHCGIRYVQKDLHTSLKLFIQIDISCNITCPSCRERMVFIKDEKIIDNLFVLTERMKEWIAHTDQPVQVELAGGDPFASILYSRVIKSYSELPNIRFSLKTNGLLLEKNCHLIDTIKDKTSFSISIDAATEETYKIVRRGGQWDTLLHNLEYFVTLNKFGMGNFVIQKTNYKECIEFVKFCKKYNLAPSFSVLQDWGTWDNFDEQVVHLRSSPYYEEFKQIFKDEIFKSVNLSCIKFWL
jgi:organic radical activating enzyme